MSTAEQPPADPFEPSLLLVVSVLVIVLGLSLAGFWALQTPNPQPPDVRVLAAALGCTEVQVDRTEAHAAVSAQCSLNDKATYLTTFTDVVARDRWLADGAGITDPRSQVVGDLWVVKPPAELVPLVFSRLGGHIQ